MLWRDAIPLSVSPALTVYVCPEVVAFELEFVVPREFNLFEDEEDLDAVLLFDVLSTWFG